MGDRGAEGVYGGGGKEIETKFGLEQPRNGLRVESQVSPPGPEDRALHPAVNSEGLQPLPQSYQIHLTVDGGG